MSAESVAAFILGFALGACFAFGFGWWVLSTVDTQEYGDEVKRDL